MDVAHACRRPALPAPANGTLLAFAAGTLLLQQAPVLPAPLALAALALPAALLAWARRRGWPLALWLGLAWFSWHAAGLLAQALPATHAGVDLVVTGTVASLPSREGRVTRFEFAPEGPATTPRVALPLGRLRLAWYGGHPPLRAGDRWQLHVRLKPPRGFRNPGGFDYAGWMFRQGLAASGYVRDGPGNARLGPARHPAARLQRLRQRLADGLAAVLGGSRFAGILAALALGER
ncbi:MAG TPA: ComEC/Rec2 family competence protein, partial [Gammaproteobacteria bacterium]